MPGIANSLNITQMGIQTFNNTTGVFTGRSIQGGTGITVLNGDGQAGNPTISLTGGGSAVEHLTGDTGGQLNPDGSNNFTLHGDVNAFAINGSGSTLTAALKSQIKMASGTALLPAYTFSADNTTGWYYNTGALQAAIGGVDAGGFTGAGALQALLGFSFQGTGTFSAGGIAYNRTATAVSYVVLSTDYIIAITDTSAARTITLPSTGGGIIAGKWYIIKDESGAAATNNISVVVNGGVKTIDGSTTYTINSNYGSITVYSNGTNYFIV